MELRQAVLRLVRPLCACAIVALLTPATGLFAQTVENASRIEQLTASAPKRVAFVVGNSAYQNAPLVKNALSDAALVSEFLEGNGYRVFTYTDLDKRGFETMLQQAYYEVNSDSEVVFYFAGHGLQVAGQNYLLPTNSDLDSPYDLPFEAVSLSNVINIIGSLARTQLYILDSCRENPFAGADLIAGVSAAMSETELGFSTLSAPVNSLISFSSSPGQRAWDGSGDHSPFTEALIATAKENPDFSVARVLEDVRRKVFETTSGTQVPWESSTLIQPIRFGGATVVSQMSLSGDVPEGDFRSWLDRAMPEVEVVGSEPAVQDGGETTLRSKVQLARQVSVEPTLASLSEDMQPDTTVELTKPPAVGRLVIARPGAMRVDIEPGQSFPLSLMEHAVYEINVPPQSGNRRPPPPTADTFILKTAVGQPVAVQMEIEPNPCDLAAGARLDPQGVGIEVFANELDPAVARPACETALQSDPGNGRFHYQLGRALLAERQLEAAENAFSKAAELGHIRAYHALGQVAASRTAAVAGAEDAAIPAEALEYYERGVAAGDPYAFHALGKQLLRFGASEAERRRGFDLLQRAVETGHTFSMNELGLYYLDDSSIDYDPERGIRYYQESAARGDIYGFANMGLAYRDGRGGLPQDIAKAAEFLEKAVAGHHPTAPRFLGLLYVEGKLGGAQSDAKALEQFDLGLLRGDAWSGVNGAWTILNRPVAGYDAQDASLRAIKSLILRGDPAATARAENYLERMPARDMSAGMQMLVNEISELLAAEGRPHPETIAVDGAFGAGSSAAMGEILDALNISLPPGANRLEQARALSLAYWSLLKIRIDTT